MTPSHPSYDVIVVGAGAAGAALAARLTEDSHRSVLLLEAGRDYPSTGDYPPEMLDAATIRAIMPGHPADWAFPAQITHQTRATINRGRALGGSLAINGAYFARARKTDFDVWSGGGNDFWTYERALPFYRRLETDLDHGETEMHGGSGPMLVRRQDLSSPFYRALHESVTALGYPDEVDKNGQQPAGFGAIPCNNPDSIRWNTGLAYINPVRAQRPNLTVGGEHFVRRVLIEGGEAVGVEVEHRGEVRRIEGGNIVLAAGAIKTPHLLLLSGIGPADDLAAAGVPIVRDAGVGRGFADHPNINLGWRARTPVTRYDQSGAWAASLNLSSGEEGYDEDIEIKFGDKPLMYLVTGQRQPQPFDNVTAVALQKGASRGNLRLVSGDPHAYPELSYNYLSEPVDVRRLISATRAAYDVLRSGPAAHYVEHVHDLDDADLRNDDGAMRAYLFDRILSGIHTTGTARFAIGDDPDAVVDQYGNVEGVLGLRVADTSLLPTPISRGPAATAVMIGEKIADHIRSGGGADARLRPSGNEIAEVSA